MPSDAPINLATQIAELKLERSLRYAVFRKLVSSGKMKASEASYRNANLEGAITTLEWLRTNRDLIAAFKKSHPETGA